MTRKQVTLDETIANRLGKESNQSRVVNQALQNYYDSEDSVGDLNQRLERIEQTLTVVRRAIQDLTQLAGV